MIYYVLDGKIHIEQKKEAIFYFQPLFKEIVIRKYILERRRSFTLAYLFCFEYTFKTLE